MFFKQLGQLLLKAAGGIPPPVRLWPSLPDRFPKAFYYIVNLAAVLIVDTLSAHIVHMFLLSVGR
jgi:hypothetical protein